MAGEVAEAATDIAEAEGVPAGAEVIEGSAGSVPLSSTAQFNRHSHRFQKLPKFVPLPRCPSIRSLTSSGTTLK